MKKVKNFEDIQSLVTTPMLGNQDYCSIASVDLFINEYGKFVISATNHDGGTGYFAISLEDLFKGVNKEALMLITESLNNEIKNREE